MAKPILVIFIDAYPYKDSSDLAMKLNACTYKSLTPGIGYSINVKAEIFAKMKPDDVGYFCEWVYDGKLEHKWMRPYVVKMLSAIGSMSNLFNRIIHKIVRIILKDPIYAIPFDVLPYLRNAGHTAYEYDFKYPTFLTRLSFDRVLYSELGVNDEKVFEKAKEVIRNNKSDRLFVGTAELDGIMHHYGKGSNQYNKHILKINNHVIEVVGEFLNIHGNDARYFIFSDHGMAPVLEGVSFDIRNVLGNPGPDTYLYFIDATFIRIWLVDKSLKERLLVAFSKLEVGHVLDDGERANYGLKDISHGDVIFLLNEGKMFAPSFFGNNICKAMHGYDPALDSQQGTLISNYTVDNDKYIYASDIYDLIMECSKS